MCFYLADRTSPSPIAEEDIIVYKVTDGKPTWKHFNSLYQAFQYERDKVNPKVELNVENYVGGQGRIDKGYHSYFQFPNYIYGDLGIFKVPKGTEYYKNDSRREIVSSQLVYLGPNTKLNRLYLRIFKGIKA